MLAMFVIFLIKKIKEEQTESLEDLIRYSLR